MQASSFLRKLLFPGLLVLLFACGENNTKEVSENTAPDTSTKRIPPAPPSAPPPRVTIYTEECYENKGLKYDVIIHLSYLSDSTVTGSVATESADTNNEETTEFEGTLHNKSLVVKFKGNPPIVGDASDWTSKPWQLKDKKGTTALYITFNAKNYTTDKWEETAYEFTVCKK